MVAPQTPPTLADVAKLAGVHSSTVSRTIARPELVNLRTRRLVTDAIEATGYTPNRAAQQLASGRSTSIGVLVPDLTNPFFSSVVRSIQHRAEQAGMLVVIADTAQRPDRELELTASLARHVAGIISASSVARSPDLLAAAGGRPVTLINRVARGMSSVVVDQQRIIDVAFEHLTSLGHTRIAVVGGPNTYWSQQRRRDAAQRYAMHAAPEDLDIIQTGATGATFIDGVAAFDRVHSTGASAVLTFNDVVASGLLRACRQHHVDVARDLSIIGSDGLPPGSLADPDLTTVAAPLDELGARSVDVVLDAIAGGAQQRLALEPALRIGATTGAPHIHHAASRSLDTAGV